jgi:hypothetical protein
MNIAKICNLCSEPFHYITISFCVPNEHSEVFPYQFFYAFLVFPVQTTSAAQLIVLYFNILSKLLDLCKSRYPSLVSTLMIHIVSDIHMLNVNCKLLLN